MNGLTIMETIYYQCHVEPPEMLLNRRPKQTVILTTLTKVQNKETLTFQADWRLVPYPDRKPGVHVPAVTDSVSSQHVPYITLVPDLRAHCVRLSR